MEPLRLDTLAPQVVAWHNRHPLARRITAAQVQAMAYLVLPAMQVQTPDPVPPAAVDEPVEEEEAVDPPPPAAASLDAPPPLAAEVAAAAEDAALVAAAAEEPAAAPAEPVPEEPGLPAVAAPVADAPAPPASSLRTRLAARPASAVSAVSATPIFAPHGHSSASPAAAGVPGQPLRLAYSERLLEHTRAPQLTRWVLQQARLLLVNLPAHAAVRELPRDAALSAAKPGVPELPVKLLLRTATLAVGARRLCLLVGSGVDPAVLGPRLWSLPRVALACLPLLMLPLTAAAAWWLGAQSARQAPLHAKVAASAPASNPVVATAASAALAASAATASQALHEAAPPVPAQPLLDAAPRLGRVDLPALGPLNADPGLEATRMRRLAARAARAAPDVAAPAQPDIRAVDPLPRATAASTAHSTGVEKSAPTATYALTTWTLRTAAESEQVQAAMRTLLALTADKAAPVQRVPVGDDWRVMAGPFVSAAVAEKARALLLARGVKTEVVHVPAASSWAGAAVPVAR